MESTRLSRMSAGLVCCLIVLAASAAFAQQNTVTFDNKSGEPALVKLVGPTQQALEVPNGRTSTVNVKAGKYYILVRYGTSNADYSYSRGERFNVRETMTQYSAVSITLHKVLGGDYETRRISSKEFTDARIPKEDTTETSSSAPVVTQPFSLIETVSVQIDKADVVWLQTAQALPEDSKKLLSDACSKANNAATRLEKLVGKDVGSALGVPAYEGTKLSGRFTRFLALSKFPIGLLSQMGAGKEVTTEHAELKKELEAKGIIEAWEESQQAIGALQDLIRRLRDTAAKLTEGNNMPVAISWATSQTGAVSIATAPNFVYRKLSDANLGTARVVVKMDAEVPGFLSTDADRVESYTLADPEGQLDLKQKGVVPASTYARYLDSYVRFLVPKGTYTLRIALFKAPVAEETPSDRISNWITVPVEF